MKILSLVFLFILAPAVMAEEKEPLPLDPKYMGEHGMALMTKSSTIFAYHLPMYHSPHNVQLLYKLEVKDFNLIQVARDNDLVTIKPEPFNLQRLMRGEELTVKADVYIGHYERDGFLVYKDMSIVFDKQLYLNELNDIAPSSKQQEYDVVSYNSKEDRLYIHRLQQAPSFDHIIHIDRSSGCLSKFKTSSAVPKRSELQYKFMNCGTMKPMYYETEDFQ